jgi:hypothetical protein
LRGRFRGLEVERFRGLGVERFRGLGVERFKGFRGLVFNRSTPKNP